MCLGIGVSLSKMWYFIDRSTVSWCIIYIISRSWVRVGDKVMTRKTTSSSRRQSPTLTTSIHLVLCSKHKEGNFVTLIFYFTIIIPNVVVVDIKLGSFISNNMSSMTKLEWLSVITPRNISPIHRHKVPPPFGTGCSGLWNKSFLYSSQFLLKLSSSLHPFQQHSHYYLNNTHFLKKIRGRQNW